MIRVSICICALLWTGCGSSSSVHQITIEVPPPEAVYQPGQPVMTPDGPGIVKQIASDSQSVWVDLSHQAGGWPHYSLDSLTATSRELHLVSALTYRHGGVMLRRDAPASDVGDLRLTPGTAAWSDERTGRLHQVPLSDVFEVRVRSTGRGAIAGSRAGVKLAALGGGILSAGALSDCSADEVIYCAAGGFIVGFLTTGVFSVPIGAAFGAIIGHEDTYQFAPAPPSSSQ